MTNTLFNGIEAKKYYSKHLIYPESNNKSSCHPQITKQQKPITINDLNQSNSHSQSNTITKRKHKDMLNSVYLQRSLFTNTHLLKDLNKQSSSFICPLSPKNSWLAKTSVPHSPTKSNDDVVNIALQYKLKHYYFYLNKSEDALVLAKKIDDELNLGLFDYQLEYLACELAKEINMIIQSIAMGTSRNCKCTSNINGFVINLQDLISRSSKIKVCVTYGNQVFIYFVSNTTEDIDETIDDIMCRLNNDIKDYEDKGNYEHNEIKKKKSLYDQERLREHLHKSISDSIKKTLSIE